MNGVNLRSRDQVSHRLFLVLPCSASARLVFWAKAGTRNNGNERSVGTCVQGSHDRGGHVSLSRCMYRVVYTVWKAKAFVCISLEDILYSSAFPLPLLFTVENVIYTSIRSLIVKLIHIRYRGLSSIVASTSVN